MRSFLILLGVMLAFSTGTDATAGPADLNAESLPSEQQQSSMLREYVMRFAFLKYPPNGFRDHTRAYARHFNTADTADMR